MRRLLLLCILSLIGFSARAQTSRIFPDSLGSYWIYTYFHISVLPGEQCFQYQLWYLDRDTLVANKHYQRIAPGYSFNNRWVYDWVRTDTLGRKLYTLDSLYAERLAFDYSVQPGDSTPLLYQRDPLWNKIREYKGKVESTGPIDYSPFLGFPPTFPTYAYRLAFRDCATGDSASGDVLLRLGATTGYPLWFFFYMPTAGGDPAPAGITCFNTRTIGAWDHDHNFCGCAVTPPPHIYAVRQLRSNPIAAKPNPAATSLTIEGLPAIHGLIYFLNPEGQKVLQSSSSILDLKALPPGLYHWRCGAYSGRVVKE